MNRFVWLVLLGSLGVGGCGKPDPTSPVSATPGASAPSDAAKLRAERVWVENCQVCHGKEGQGDGAAASNLSPRPRRMSDPEWQKGVTDAQLRRVIIKGGAAVGLSKSMPAAPALASDRAALDVLVAKIRGFGK